MQWFPVAVMCLKAGIMDNAEVTCHAVTFSGLDRAPITEKARCEEVVQAGMWRLSRGVVERFIDDTAGVRGACFYREAKPSKADVMRRLKSEGGDEM